MNDITRVPWRVSGSPYGAVVCDAPSRPTGTNDSAYGGYLVCESVASPKTKRLIAAAPEMRDLIERIDHAGAFAEETIIGRAIKEILDRTTGESA